MASVVNGQEINDYLFPQRLEYFVFVIHSHLPSLSLFVYHTQEGDEEEITPGYKAPKKVDLKTIQDLDAEDESLVKYKQQLLGQTTSVLG